jgi:hypothetical protein
MQAKARRRKRDWRTSDPWRARARSDVDLPARARGRPVRLSEAGRKATRAAVTGREERRACKV